MLKLTSFGMLQLTLDNRELSHQITGKPLALFLYLATTGRVHTRNVLADLLWSELANQQARNNLRYLLPDLRKVVGDYLLITPQTIAFNRQATYWLDIEIVRTMASKPVEEGSSQELQAALDLYQGDFLAGFTVRNAPIFEAWVAQTRAEMRTLVIQKYHRLTEYYLQQGDYSAGLAMSQQLVTLEPWHEAGQRLQMQLLAASGQRSTALTHYEGLRQLLAKELQAAPEPETTALYEQLRAGGYDKKTRRQEEGETRRQEDKKIRRQETPSSPLPVFPSSLLPFSPPHNLPTQLTPFIGREKEIAAISGTLLEPEQRLLTLVGEGGIGKTRLAVAVAQSILDFGRGPLGALLDSSTGETSQNLKSKIQSLSWKDPKFPDGIWFVPLAGLTVTDDLPNRLAGAIAAAMQLPFSGQAPLSEQLFRQLQSKQSLLLLDSFEHLLDSADFILELLRKTRAIKILVTSRHILNFQAEYAWRLEGLSVPQPEDVESLVPELLLRYESVTLFVERARRVMHGFTLTPKNQQEVARICQFVHGLPLGAELAAALTRHYTCTEIAQALEQSYAILSTAQRDIPPRHRSIQATLAYSWSFLSEPEARVAAQCSIFRGGFTPEAAEQIVGANRTLLDALEEHSLVRLARGPGGSRHYEMHELVRQYAADQLQNRPTVAQQTQVRFGAYYANFIQARVEALVHDQQAQSEMQSDLNNLRKSWQWAVDQTELDALDKSSDGLFRFYFIKSMYQEGELAAHAAVTALRTRLAEPSPRVDRAQARYALARALLTQARFCERLAKLEEAEQLTQEGMQEAQALGAVELEARGYLELAAIAQIRLDNTTMRRIGEKVMALVAAGGFSPLEGVRVQGYGLKYQGIYGVYTGDYAQAAACFNQGLQLAQQIVDRELETMLVNNLGVVYTMSGNFTQALHCYHQTLAISRTLGEQNGAGLALINLGETYHALGDWEQAKEYIGQALALYHEAGYALYEAKAWARLGRIAHAAGNESMAQTYLEQALQIAQTAHLPAVEAEFLTDMGHVLIGLQRFDEAEVAYRQALIGWQQIGAIQPGWRVQAGLAQVALLRNQLAAAQGYIEDILRTLPHVPINAIHEPIFVYWISYQVLTANQDPRSHDLLQQGYALLQSYAAQIDDSRLQHSFVNNIAVHRVIYLLAQQAKLT